MSTTTSRIRERSTQLWPILKMASRSERVKALLTRVYEEQGAITSVNDLRDFAIEDQENEENPLIPTYKEVEEFLGDKGRSQVFKEVKQEWP